MCVNLHNFHNVPAATTNFGRSADYCVLARLRSDRLKCFAIRLYLGNLYQARNEIELAINKAIYHVKSDKYVRKC